MKFTTALILFYLNLCLIHCNQLATRAVDMLDEERLRCRMPNSKLVKFVVLPLLPVPVSQIILMTVH